MASNTTGILCTLSVAQMVSSPFVFLFFCLPSVKVDLPHKINKVWELSPEHTCTLCSTKSCSLMFHTASVWVSFLVQFVLNSVERFGSDSGQLKDTREFLNGRSEHQLLMEYKAYWHSFPLILRTDEQIYVYMHIYDTFFPIKRRRRREQAVWMYG